MTSKNYIRSILTFFIVFLLLFLCLEYLSRPIPNVYDFKQRSLEKNYNKLKVLILGSSHSYYGLNPEYISRDSFNMGMVSQDFKYDSFILNKNIDNLKKLELVILPISVFSLYSELDDGVEKWRAYNYRHWLYEFQDYEFSELFDLKNWSVILASPNKMQSILRIYEHYSEKGFQPSWSMLGQGSDYSKTSSSDELLSSGRSAAKRHQSKNGINQRSLDSLKNIILTCKSKNVRLLLITTPAYYTYRMNLDSARLLKMQTMVQELTLLHKNTVYKSYLSDDRFSSNDFYDADHLNHNGSEKFSKIINDDIEKWMSE